MLESVSGEQRTCVSLFVRLRERVREEKERANEIAATAATAYFCSSIWARGRILTAYSSQNCCNIKSASATLFDSLSHSLNLRNVSYLRLNLCICTCIHLSKQQSFA